MLRLVTLTLLLLTPLLFSKTKIALLGDSITTGAGAEPRKLNGYQAKLTHLLGEEYNVQSFAAGGHCLALDAKASLAKTQHFQNALYFKPDIAVIVLGTNDSNTGNWKNHPSLKDDTLEFIARLRRSNPKMIVHLCSPPPMFPTQKGLKPDRIANLTERAERLPYFSKTYADIAKNDPQTHFHDLSRALRPGDTTDGVHPSNFGHERMAYHFYDLLTTDWQPSPVPAFSGKTSSFHHFTRHDFSLDNFKATVVVPNTPQKSRPWIWRARFFGHQPDLDLALLDRGYHLAYCDVSNLYGNDEAMKRALAFHTHLTQKFNLHPKPILEGMSRGGLFIFNFAAKHPDKVTAIYGDNPVCDFNSWPGGKNGKLSAPDYARCLAAYGITEEKAATHPQIASPDFAKRLATHKIPVALVVGTKDDVVPPQENALAFASHYKNAPLRIWKKPGLGHHPHGLTPHDPLLRFLTRAFGAKSNPAAIPAPSSEYRSGAGWDGNWWQAFDHLKAQAATHPNAQIVFLGDSITQGLTGHQNRAFKFGDKSALSLGLSGDRTEHLLWRIENGQLDALTPTHLVLMIGVNNINQGHTGEEIAIGTRSIVELLRQKLPNTKIILHGCFPTGKTNDDPKRDEVNTIHTLIAPLHNGKNIIYLDLRPLFLNPDGSLNNLMSNDTVHINQKGRQAWLNALEKTIP